MKRVAFLSFDWDYKVVNEYYLGMQEYLANRAGVQVVVFNAYGRYYASHTPRESTFEVFSLYDVNSFDGLLVQGNRTWPPELRQKLVDEAVALGKPVVSINYELEGAHSVGTDNYQEEYNLVKRVITDRGCKRPAFVNGLRTSVEAQARAQGYRDACAELGIADVRFYQANWQLSAGVVTAKKMLRNPNDLPDVVFCCNDDLAVGVTQTLVSAGVHVPEEILVAGFDNREISRSVSPWITTVDRDYKTVGSTAPDMLVRLMANEEVDKQEYSPAKHVLTESCGYAGQSNAAREAGLLNADNARFGEVFGSFQFAAYGDESLYTLLENCEIFAAKLDCHNAFLVLNEDYLQSNTLDAPASYGSTSLLMACKGRATTLHCNTEHVYASFATRNILPDEVPLHMPIYTVSPLHYNDACIGILVTEGVPVTMTKGLMAYFLTTLACAIEMVRRGNLLRQK